MTEVLASWPRLSTLQPVWFALAIAFEVGHFMRTFGVQRLALRTKAWFPIVTSQLAAAARSRQGSVREGWHRHQIPAAGTLGVRSTEQELFKREQVNLPTWHVGGGLDSNRSSGS